MKKIITLLIFTTINTLAQCPILNDPFLDDECGPLITLDASQISGFNLTNPQFYVRSQIDGGGFLPFGTIIDSGGFCQLPNGEFTLLDPDFDIEGNFKIYVYDEGATCIDEISKSFKIKEEIFFASNGIRTICPGEYSLNIDLFENAPSNFGNGSFKWKASENSISTAERTGLTGLSSELKFTSNINDVLNYDGNSNNLVVYEVIPTSEDGCLGRPFTILVSLPTLPLVRRENIQFTECNGTQLDLFLDNFVNKFGHNYLWNAQDNPNIEGESTTQQTTNRIDDILINSSDINQNIIYTITPQNSNCTVPSFDITITVENCSVLSIDELSIDSFKMYPNPTERYLNIQNIKSDFKFKIYDIAGKKIQEGVNSLKIDLENTPNGFYILQIIIGTKTKEYKFVKK